MKYNPIHAHWMCLLNILRLCLNYLVGLQYNIWSCSSDCFIELHCQIFGAKIQHCCAYTFQVPSFYARHFHYTELHKDYNDFRVLSSSPKEISKKWDAKVKVWIDSGKSLVSLDIL